MKEVPWRRIFVATKIPSSKLEAISSRLPRAAIALGMAILLWLYVTSTIDTQRILYPAVEVELRNLPPDMVLVSRVPTVTVTIQPLSPVLGGQIDRPRAYVDLSGVGPGVHTLPVQIEGLPGAQIVDVSPRRVRVILRKILSRKYPVQVQMSPQGINTNGKLKFTVEPKEVTVSGTMNQLSRVQKVVANINQQTLKPGTEITAEVQAYDENNRVIDSVTIDPQQVKIRITPQETPTPSPS
ncbi:YbbR family protein [Thermobaculum terrenum ATCC BAA-798]|uniref:YbbR family protein n=1 Tax=Thermobaculum terrenum (strain ATCC BAA-798 / CCMEE 7001 / YNP1) TaxID=525904 RepID=D1CD60_THET1|nr:CdaR family protein [Thermobaculum terrenum]ACZ42725.1 YbbR family protein [Thermobaculum terrenum ATCC BAA-798]